MNKSLMPAKQAVTQHNELQKRAELARIARVMDYLIAAVKVGIEMGEVCIQIYSDDLDVARRLLDEGGYIWSELDQDQCRSRRDIGLKSIIRLDLTQYQEPSGD